MLGGRTIARVILLIVASAMIWIGIGFAAFAIATALAPHTGLAGGAAIAAAILLLPSITAYLVLNRRRPAAKPESSGSAEAAVLAALAAFAKDQPLMGLLSAAVFGAADVWMKRRKK